MLGANHLTIGAWQARCEVHIAGEHTHIRRRSNDLAAPHGATNEKAAVDQVMVASTAQIQQRRSAELAKTNNGRMVEP